VVGDLFEEVAFFEAPKSSTPHLVQRRQVNIGTLNGEIVIRKQSIQNRLSKLRKADAQRVNNRTAQLAA